MSTSNTVTPFKAFEALFHTQKNHPNMSDVKPAFDYTKDPDDPANVFMPTNHNDPILHPLRNLKDTLDQNGVWHGGTVVHELTEHITGIYTWMEDQSYLTIQDFLENRVYMIQWYKNRGRTERFDDISGGAITPVTAGDLLDLYADLGISAADQN